MAYNDILTELGIRDGSSEKLECIAERDQPVTDGAKKIGTWPPLATYPLNPGDLKETASVSGKLTFADPAGNVATALRSVESPADGNPVVTVDIDPRLWAHLQDKYRRGRQAIGKRD